MKYLWLLIFLLPSCVSLNKYRSDVDTAEIFGEMVMINRIFRYESDDYSARDRIELLNARLSILEMRLLNQRLRIYQFPFAEEYNVRIGN